MQLEQVALKGDLSHYINVTGEAQGSLSGFQKVNIFIGANNSGKSRILRELFLGRFKGVFSGISEIHESSTNRLHNELSKSQYRRIGQLTEEIIDALKYGVPVSISDGSVVVDEDIRKTVQQFLNEYQSGRSFEIDIADGTKMISRRELDHSWDTREIVQAQNGYVNDVRKLSDAIHTTRFNSIYVPVLRGMRPLIENEDPYLARTDKDYFSKVKKPQNAEVLTGSNIFFEIRKLLLGDKKERKLVNEFELFLEAEIFLKEVTLVPKEGEDVLLITIGDEEERLLYNLGDGVQSMIILCWILFKNKSNEVFIFIEEPELNLHPGMQRRLLDVMENNFPKHQYFITSHSNHFLEAVYDSSNVSLFSLKKKIKEEQFELKVLNSPDNSVLVDLGVRNTSLFLANCTLWVEGITDRMYIKKYLELFLRDLFGEVIPFKEGQHYSFVEYGGGNVVHWSFLDNVSKELIDATKISNNILLIVDSDHKNGVISKTKQARFKEFRRQLGDRFIQLPVKEIENLLSTDTIHKTILDFEKKEEDQIILKSNSDYKKKNLGEWIDNSFEGLTKKYAKGNTIDRKVEFAKKSILNLETYSDLSPQAKRFTKSVFKFIEECNKSYY